MIRETGHAWNGFDRTAKDASFIFFEQSAVQFDLAFLDGDIDQRAGGPFQAVKQSENRILYGRIPALSPR